jgi:tetratricopeptide (TPR) repeat protein
MRHREVFSSSVSAPYESSGGYERCQEKNGRSVWKYLPQSVIMDLCGGDRVGTADRRAELLAALESQADDAVISAAQDLLALGEYGDPRGAVHLKGTKAALRQWQMADAVVLTYQGLKVVEPGGLVWAEILANRAIACAYYGAYSDAISAGQRFLEHVDSLPEQAAAIKPYVHHALGLVYDRRKEYEQAAIHYRLAADLYDLPGPKSRAHCDLAYSLTLSGEADQAEAVMAMLDCTPFTEWEVYAYWASLVVVKYHKGQPDEAWAAATTAETIGKEFEDRWGSSIPELQYWMSRIAMARGDKLAALKLGLAAAVKAHQNFNVALRETALNWLEEIVAPQEPHSA